MRKVCIVTAARSEYGLLRWIIDYVHNDESLELQLVVTGAHLSPEQGMTINAIINDGYPISKKVEFLLSTDSDIGIAKSMGVCCISFADTFAELRPNIVVVLGDRYELLPICSAALIMNIPIAHIGGGDITQGAIDDQVRNAITMLSSLHFPSVKSSYDNIVKLRGSSDKVYQVGETGLDNYNKLQLKSRTQLADELALDSNKDWILVTLHPETKLSVIDNLKMAKCMMEALLSLKNIEVIVSSANADLGGYEINDYIQKLNNIHWYQSLGQLNYLSLMKNAACVVGNSSSGILETPILGIPTINIGNRQKGRHISPNVINCERDTDSINKAIHTGLKHGLYTSDTYFGDGFSSERIYNQIKKYLNGI